MQFGIARLDLHVDKWYFQVLSRAAQNKSTATLSGGQDILVSVGEDASAHAFDLTGHDVFQAGLASVAAGSLASQGKSVQQATPRSKAAYVHEQLGEEMFFPIEAYYVTAFDEPNGGPVRAFFDVLAVLDSEELGVSWSLIKRELQIRNGNLLVRQTHQKLQRKVANPKRTEAIGHKTL